MSLKKSLYSLILLSLFQSCAGQTEKETDTMHTNALIHESSPYLLHHAHNPVNWYPWGTEALAKARSENKMLIVSVGYSACHWCHVMERESFEDEEVAEIMNRHFVAVKVDREERPDVDQVYMDAAHLITGRGGWPLNAFALPDGQPFYAGTYFPKKDWINVLNYFVDQWDKNPEQIQEQAEKVTRGIRSYDFVPLKQATEPFSVEQLDAAFSTKEPQIDYKKGGRKENIKFPMPVIWEYLLHYHQLSGNEKALEAVHSTLDNLAWGGIYDHIGGGFARYSTDPRWHIPHFEKMLYDNAQLVSLYSKAWQQDKNPLYKQVVYETLGFIAREMTAPNGGFYTALDADSEGEEGAFYVWTQAELDAVLGEGAELFSDYYNTSKRGNWEQGKNVLFKNRPDAELAEKHGLSIPDLHQKIAAQKARLLQTRAQRERPGLDDKILTSWNTLMLKGYVAAYRAFDEAAFLEAGLKNAHFLVKNALAEDGELTRNHKDGKSGIAAFLDDYAFVASAFIDLYQASFDEQWLYRAQQITDYAHQHFFDSDTGLYFYTHDQHTDLVARKKELSDNVIPASNSEMAKNLFILGHYFYDKSYSDRARQMLANLQDNLAENLFFYANWAVLHAHFAKPPYEVAIVGPDAQKLRAEMDQHYRPDALYLGGNDEGTLQLLENKLIDGQTTLFVCRNKACKRPVTQVEEAWKLMRD